MQIEINETIALSFNHFIYLLNIGTKADKVEHSGIQTLGIKPF